jgi:hypothetical protein
MQHEFEANPMLYVVGTAHSHPSGGTALPSDADIRNIQNLFGSNGHSSFDLIHAPGAIVSRDGEILHGPAADAYLRAHAQESVGQWVMGAGGRRQKNITPTGPRTITPYGQSVGALQSKPEERIGRLGVGQSVTNIYNAITGGFDTEQYPTTHGWLGAKGEFWSNQNFAPLNGDVVIRSRRCCGTPKHHRCSHSIPLRFVWSVVPKHHAF